jgi:hypothetical protein
MVLLALVAALAPAAICVGACGGGDDTNPLPTSPLDVSDVLYEGGASDEALIALLSAQPQSVPEQAAVFTSPADGATVPADPAPKFAWRIGAATGMSPRPAPCGALALRAPASRCGGSWLRAALSVVPSAHAHGTPVNGRAYLVLFSDAKGAPLLRVFTTRLDYTPDAAAWSKLRAVGGPVTVSALNGLFENDRLAPGAAPFEGVPSTFAIAP